MKDHLNTPKLQVVKTVKWLQLIAMQSLQLENKSELQPFHAVKKSQFIIHTQQNYLHLGKPEKTLLFSGTSGRDSVTYTLVNTRGLFWNTALCC